MVFLGVKLDRVDRIVLTIIRGIGQSLFSISHVVSIFEQCGKMKKNSERTSWEIIVSLSLRIPAFLLSDAKDNSNFLQETNINNCTAFKT